MGLQTLIRRVGTKDGLSRAVNEWVEPQVAEDRGEPVSSDAAAVAAAMARHYERWADITDRTLRQQDSLPALAEAAEAGRVGHREWLAAAFADVLGPLDPDARHRLLGRLVGVCGVELWLVLRRDARLSADEARDAVADLVSACLQSVQSRTES